MKSLLRVMVMVLSLSLTIGCNGTGPGQSAGVNLNVSGPPNVSFAWTSTSVPNGQICCTNCFVNGTGTFHSNGTPVVFQHVRDNAGYFVQGLDGCMGSAVQPFCAPNQPVFLICSAHPQSSAQGTITINGSVSSKVVSVMETVCDESGQCTRQRVQETVWNSGSVSAIFAGQTVTTTVDQNSTLSSAAAGLAYAIDANSVLNTQFIAVPQGSSVIVKALQTGTQYNYQWQPSCTYNTQWFTSCSVAASLSPLSALASP
jgi:hypothetical protein